MSAYGKDYIYSFTMWYLVTICSNWYWVIRPKTLKVSRVHVLDNTPPPSAWFHDFISKINQSNPHYQCLFVTNNSLLCFMWQN